jgi:hypothetical protein
MTTNRNKIECRTDNRRLAYWLVKWLIEHSTSHQLLWCIDSFVLRNSPERKARKRYHLLRKNPCTERFGDFLFSITTRKDYFRWEKCAQQRGS